MNRSLRALKLPRKVEADPRHKAVEEALAKDLRPLWEKGTAMVAHFPLSSSLEDSLVRMRNVEKLDRGLESIERALEIEKKGIEALQTKQGTPPPLRVSRLLFMANDGSERFYRACETALFNHGDRLLGIYLDVPSTRLGQNLFGPEKPTKALLVSDRDGVSSVLLSLLESRPTK